MNNPKKETKELITFKEPLERIIYLGVNLTEKYSTYILKIIKIC
jgi:hypothetical protein